MSNLDLAKEQGNQAAPNVIDAVKAQEVQLEIQFAEEQGNQATPLLADSLTDSDAYEAIKQQGNQAMPLIVDALIQPEPEPYTPDPWLKLTSEADGSQVAFYYEYDEIAPQLEYSMDGKNWSTLQVTVEYGEAFSDYIQIDEGDVVYVRASNHPDLYSLTPYVEGSVYMEGNIYAMVSNSPSDWDILTRISFEEALYVTHLPDFPASVLPEGSEYQDFLLSMSGGPWLKRTTCVVSDNGFSFNFHIGVTPQDLVDAGLIDVANDLNMALYLGNVRGFTQSGNYVMFTPPTCTQDIQTNGTITGGVITFEDAATAEFVWHVDTTHSFLYSTDGGDTLNDLVPDENDTITVSGIVSGTLYIQRDDK